MKAALPALYLGALALGSTACLTSVEPLCRPCEPGGCSDGLVCSPSADGMVCAPAEGGAAVCGLAAADAGTPDSGLAPDAGVAPDAGQPADAGPSRCPAGGADGLTWRASDPAGVCFLETEVTVRQFEPCATSTTCAPEFSVIEWSDVVDPFCNLGKPGRRDHPMNCMDERAAAGFCTSIGGRLPSRDQWAAEASAGGTRTYPWGEETPDCARAIMAERDALPGCDTNDAFEPCSRPAGNSVSGLCDMSGNLWEMTADFRREDFIMCGGSLTTTLDPDFLRTDVCSFDAGRHDYIGFRCVTDFVR